MALSVNPLTRVISVPKADLTLVSGTLYSLDTSAFRLELKSWEDSEEGMVQPKTHLHNTEYTIAGVTYARAINMLAPYSIEFEDGQYSIILSGSNNNIWDIAGGILVQNQVQVIPTNAAGLITTTIVSGSGVTAQDKLDIADQVWNETLADHNTVGSTGKALSDVSGGSSPETIAAAVWAHATRSLTTFGSLVSDIWSYATRLLTGSGLTASEQAELTGVKAKTDNLPADPAGVTDVPTSAQNAGEVWQMSTSSPMMNTDGTAGKMMKDTKKDVGDAQGLILAK